MVTRGSTNLTYATLVNYFPEDYSLSNQLTLDENILNMAFGMSDFDNPFSSALDPTVLSIYVGLKVI